VAAMTIFTAQVSAGPAAGIWRLARSRRCFRFNRCCTAARQQLGLRPGTESVTLAVGFLGGTQSLALASGAMVVADAGLARSF